MERDILKEIFDFSQIQPASTDEALAYLQTMEKISRLLRQMISDIGYDEEPPYSSEEFVKDSTDFFKTIDSFKGKYCK